MDVVVQNSEGGDETITLEWIEDDMFLVLDADGNPLGTIIIPPGTAIEDLDILDEMIPLDGLQLDILDKPNPVTSDAGADGYIFSSFLLIGAVAFCIYLKKRMKDEEDAA